MTQIGIMAGEIWLELDKLEGMTVDDLCQRLEYKKRPKDLFLMALGWLVYQKHIQWISGEQGGRLFFVKEELRNEESIKNDLTFSRA